MSSSFPVECDIFFIDECYFYATQRNYHLIFQVNILIKCVTPENDNNMKNKIMKNMYYIVRFVNIYSMEY